MEALQEESIKLETLQEELMRMSDECEGRIAELLILASVKISKQEEKISNLKIELEVEKNRVMF